MSASTAIGLVSESLRNLLLGEMIITPSVNVTILAPDETGGDRRINLFLYKVQENPPLKNLDWQVKRGDAKQLVPPPLSLNLYYLLTPYISNDEQTGNSSAHKILGDAMRVFYENAIVPQQYLANELQDAREQIKIMLNTLDMDELSQVWNTFSSAFRLSVLYEVSVVQLDMLTENERTMAERVRKIGVPTIQAPYSPPTVEKLEPLKGVPGSDITFHGKHLKDWYAYITIMEQQILDGILLTDNSFTVTLPTDLAPGFYEIKVDISHLFRRTFFFEIE